MSAPASDPAEILTWIERIRERAIKIPQRGPQLARQLDTIAERIVTDPGRAAGLVGALEMVERLVGLSEQAQRTGAGAPEQLRMLEQWAAGGGASAMGGLLRRAAADARSISRTLDSARAMWTGQRQTADVPLAADPDGDPLNGISIVLTDIAMARGWEIWSQSASRLAGIIQTRFGEPAKFAAAVLDLHPQGRQRKSLVADLLGPAIGPSPRTENGWLEHYRPWPEPVADVLPFLLNGLAEQDDLDAATFRRAAAANPGLILHQLGGLSQAPLARPLTDRARAVLRDAADGLALQLAIAPDEQSWTIVQHARGLRGSQFLPAALDLYTGARGPGVAGALWVPKLISRLLSADGVDPAEGPGRAQLLAGLRSQPMTVLDGMLALSLAAPVVPSVLAQARGWRAAVPLLSLVVPLICGMPGSPDPESGAADVAVIADVLARVPEPLTREVLAWFSSTAAGIDKRLRESGIEPDTLAYGSSGAASFALLVRAAAGWNRPQVLASMRRHGHVAVRACGLLPLDGPDEVLARYVALESERGTGRRLGPNRRVNHATAVRAALSHLAQLAGYASVSRLQWAMELRLAGPGTPAAGSLTADREGLAALRQRLCRELIEPLVASGELIGGDELRALLSLEAARGLLGSVVVRAPGRGLGILDPEDQRINGLSMTWPLDGPVGVAHPWHLAAAGELERWQHEVTVRGIDQPVPQVFRELHQVAAADRAGTESARFADLRMRPRIVRRMLAERGWRTVTSRWEGNHSVRQAGGICAVLPLHYLGGDQPVSFGALRFEPAGPADRPGDGRPVPLADVPPLLLSEALRDLELIAAAAAWRPAGRGGTGA